MTANSKASNRSTGKGRYEAPKNTPLYSRTHHGPSFSARRAAPLLLFFLILFVYAPPATVVAQAADAEISASNTPGNDPSGLDTSDGVARRNTTVDTEDETSVSTDAAPDENLPKQAIDRSDGHPSTPRISDRGADTDLTGMSLASLDPAEIAARAEQAERDLAAFEERLAVPSAVAALREDLRRKEPELIEAIAAARATIAHHIGWFLAADVRFDFHLRLAALQNSLTPVDAFRASTASIAEAVETLSKEWQRMQGSLREVGAPAAVINRAGQVVKRAHVVEIRVRRAQSAVALTTAQVERMRGMIDDVLSFSRTGGPSLSRDFDVQGHSPIFAPLPPFADFGAAFKRSLRHAVQTAERFARISIGPLLLQLLIFAALWVFARRGRAPGGERFSEAAVELIFRRPMASAALAALLLSIVIYQHVPASVVLLLLTLCFAATAYLQIDGDRQQNRMFALGGFVLIGFLILHTTLADLPNVRRWIFGAEGSAVFFFALLMTRLRQKRGKSGGEKGLIVFSRISLSASGLGLLLWVFGLDIASAILIDGTARLMLLTVVFRVSYEVVTSFARSLVQTETAQMSRMLRLRGKFVTERFAVLLRWALGLLWAGAVLDIYTLREPVLGAIGNIVEKKLDVGSLHVTIGDGLALVIGFFLALFASRFTRFLLEEELLPRTSLTLGSRAAVISSAGYVVLGVGIFMALAAVGFELDKITILVSALGVGIGFGLQNLVQNFVAGIILIFGRPINVGDRVEVAGLLGKVMEVGFRASTIKTIQGAEVIVPNSQFVSEQVINWSLSDEHRRIEIDVGVKYGTDPEKVIALLLKSVEGHKDVLDDPAPEALFMGFGASSLDFQLQVWTARGAAWLALRSALTISVNRLLAEAKIEIPFPQRDLNVRTIDPSLLAKLDVSRKSNR